MAKPIKSLALHYPMIQFFYNTYYTTTALHYSVLQSTNTFLLLTYSLNGNENLPFSIIYFNGASNGPFAAYSFNNNKGCEEGAIITT